MLTFLSILDKLLTLIQGWAIVKEQKNAQEQRNEIENNPSGWFTTHFSGMPTDSSQTDKTNPKN
jgi:hypothetical protein